MLNEAWEDGLGVLQAVERVQARAQEATDVGHLLVAERGDEDTAALGGRDRDRDARKNRAVYDFRSSKIHFFEHAEIGGAGDNLPLAAVADNPQFGRFLVKQLEGLTYSLLKEMQRQRERRGTG